jgi:O-acetyl-ADP-ribose deacetylase (regulator of RNase III)
VITTAGNLKARYVIHTVGPVWRGGRQNEPQLLSEAYCSSLMLAVEKGLHSVSFPSVSTGAYGYPVELAAPVAIGAILQFLESKGCPADVRIVLHDSSTLRAYEDALKEQPHR